MKVTGKDVILLILKHDLIDSELNVSLDETLLTTEQAAVKLGISTSSLLDMAKLGIVESLDIGDEQYFYDDIELTSIKKEKL